jgi:hypothetical protein
MKPISPPLPLNERPRAYQLRAIKRDPLLIKHVSAPDQDLQYEALCRNAGAYKMIANVDPSALLRAVKKNPILLHLAPAECRSDLQLAAVISNSAAIHHVREPSVALQLAAVNAFPQAIEHIKDPDVSVQYKVLTSNLGLSLFKAHPGSFALDAVGKRYPHFTEKFCFLLALGIPFCGEFTRLLHGEDEPPALRLPDIEPTF